MMQAFSPRLPAYDRLRIFACFCMVMMHVCAQDWYALAPATAEWQIVNLFNGMTRFCVPVFMMISGAFFLDASRPCPHKRLFGRHILRMAVAYLFWSALYAICFGLFVRESGAPIDWVQILHDTIYGHYHLWFVLTMIGFYLSVPLLRCICRDRKTEGYFLLIAVTAVFVVNGLRQIPAASAVIDATLTKLHLEFFLGCSVYFVLGHFLASGRLSRRAEMALIVLGGLSLVGTIALTAFLSVRGGMWNSVWYGNLMPGTALTAAAVFMAFKRWAGGGAASGRTAAIRTRAAQLVFGVYLVHDFFIEALRAVGITASSFALAAAIPLVSVLVMGLSYIVVWLLSRIPVINRYLI